MTDFSGGYLKNKDLLTPMRPAVYQAKKKSDKEKGSRSFIKQGKDIDIFSLDDIPSDKSEIELLRQQGSNKNHSRMSAHPTVDEEIKGIQYEIHGAVTKAGKQGSCTCQIVRSAGL